jgi:hypothetical protein
MTKVTKEMIDKIRPIKKEIDETYMALDMYYKHIINPKEDHINELQGMITDILNDRHNEDDN